MLPSAEFFDIVSAVIAHAEHDPKRLCVRTFSRRVHEAERTYGDVVEAAGRSAACLQASGIGRGDIVVLIGTHHIDFYAAWLSCVWLGAVPTVLAEPSVRINQQVYWTRLRELFARIQARGIIVDPRVRIDAAQLGATQIHRYDEVTAATMPPPDRVHPAADDLLLLQHSSGTTGLQKGVMLSHGAVWQHAVAYCKALQLTSDDIAATWLPLYHDMGFIACFVNGLLSGTPMIWLSPFEWVANPALLLEAISRYHATLAWLPNFAFPFLAQRVKAEPGTFDLTSLRALINCSEPVTAEAMRMFADRFAADGFAPTALQACYAMAENVFAVSTSTATDPSRERRICKVAWRDEHQSILAAETDPADQTTVHVSNGRVIDDCEVRVVNPAGDKLPPLHAGEVLIRSPYLFSGYFRREELNRTLFSADGFYNTGDLGYLDPDGHLYVTGRAKDLVIVGGKNIYPQDVEQVVSEVSGVYPGRVVCFGVSLPTMGTEGLVVLVESEADEAVWTEIIQQIRMAVPSRLDLDLTDVRVVARGELRKSTAGKLARDGNRQWYLDSRFGALPVEVSTQE